MNAVVNEPMPVCHFVKGRVVEGGAVQHGPAHARFSTPELRLDELVWSRKEIGPAFDTPLDDILDLLEATGRWLQKDPEGIWADAMRRAMAANPMHPNVMQRSYEIVPAMFARRLVLVQIENELGGRRYLDGWAPVTNLLEGRVARMRAFPSRILHVIAGNAPGVAALSVMRGAVTKSLNLIKLPSNDLFTTVAILRGMAAVAPDHPVVRSFSAAYWRGGDAKVESALLRPQFFDKFAAWGGLSTLETAKKYISPGLELVAFDPKTSISFIGAEAFESEEVLDDVADRAAADVTLVDQFACASSRFVFVEGTTAQADRLSEKLQRRLSVERFMASAEGRPLPGPLREEIDALRVMPQYYRTWGDYSGKGMVIRSEEPVEFHPEYRVANVVPVKDLADAVEHVNVATQTVGVYPSRRQEQLRNALAAAGAQRVVALGGAGSMGGGLAHDGFLPLSRLVRWINDEG
jgi:hypothetical protein